MKKKILEIVLCSSIVIAMSGCASDENVGGREVLSKSVSFHVAGNWDSPSFTRSLSADGIGMADLWVFDFMGGNLVQMLHQNGEDSDFGNVSMTMLYGAHQVCFVASRGLSPEVDEVSHSIMWEGPRDTFWKRMDVAVSSSGGTDRSVVLDRVATKLRINVEDEVPTGAASLSVIPSSWFYGVDYLTGEAVVNHAGRERKVAIPASCIGTSGNFSVSIFGISGSTEWKTDVQLLANDEGGNVIGSVNIYDAPFVRNRATEYSGVLFSDGGSLFSVDLHAEWEVPFVGTW